MLQIKIIIYERPHFSAGVGSTGVDKKPATKSLYVLDCKRAERDKHHGDNLTQNECILRDKSHRST